MLEQHMSDGSAAEFSKEGPNIARSSRGFTVRIITTGGIVYSDSSGEYTLSSELLVNPFRILIYKPLIDQRGFLGCSQQQIDDMFSDTIRAMQFLGHSFEVWQR